MLLVLVLAFPRPALVLPSLGVLNSPRSLLVNQLRDRVLDLLLRQALEGLPLFVAKVCGEKRFPLG